MPGFNRKGPNGEGSMTGRKMGRCNPENKQNVSSDVEKSGENESSSERNFGRGNRRGCGMGRGWRFWRND